MRISHNDAIVLEGIVRRVHSCDRAGMGGFIDADNFKSNPFDAALIALAPYWKIIDSRELEDFLYKWDCALRSDNKEPVDIDAYVQELESLVTKVTSC